TGYVAEKPRRFIHRQIENVGDVLAFVSDLQRLAVIAFAVAHFAFDVNVRQKVHLDFNQSAAFAIFAAAAFDIETEPPRVITAHPRCWQVTEQFADLCERAGVGHWIRTRRSANRALVDDDCFIDLFHSANRSISARFFPRIVKMPKQSAPQNVIQQGGFTAAGDTSYTSETAK